METLYINPELDAIPELLVAYVYIILVTKDMPI